MVFRLNFCNLMVQRERERERRESWRDGEMEKEKAEARFLEIQCLTMFNMRRNRMNFRVPKRMQLMFCVFLMSLLES